MNRLKILKGHQYFEAQEKGEEVNMVVRMHWLILATPLVVGPIVTIFLSVFGFAIFNKSIGFIDTPEAELLKVVLVSATLLLGSLYIFSSWLSRYFNVLILTNKHIVDVTQVALFSRKVSTLSLDSIEDVAIEKQGFFSNIFDYGDILIQTAGELPNFRLDKISDPESVQKSIMEAKAVAHPRHK